MTSISSTLTWSMLFLLLSIGVSPALAESSCLVIEHASVNQMGSRVESIRATHHSYLLRNHCTGKTVRKIGRGPYNACELNHVTADLSDRLDNLEEGKMMLTPAIDMASALLLFSGTGAAPTHSHVMTRLSLAWKKSPAAALKVVARLGMAWATDPTNYVSTSITQTLTRSSNPAIRHYDRQIDRNQSKSAALTGGLSRDISDKEMLALAESLDKTLLRTPATLKVCDPKKAAAQLVDHPTLRESVVKTVPGIQEGATFARDLSAGITRKEESLKRRAKAAR